MTLTNTIEPLVIDVDLIKTHRILAIEDNLNIHHDFMKILMPDYFDNGEQHNQVKFDLKCAAQGQEGCQLIEQANDIREPYSVVFVDISMPSGWDGLETIKQIVKIDKNIQIVLCTAYSDYTWTELVTAVVGSEHLLILKKPFDHLEVWQMACCLSEKWFLNKQTKEKVKLLELSYDIIVKSNENYKSLIKNSETAVEKKKMAVEAKAKFLANMTHEIRTPMTAILGFSEMLCEENLLSQFSEVNKPFIKNIHGSCEHLLTVINDILDLSKIEVGKMDVESLECSPFEIVTQLQNEYAASAMEKDLALSVDYQFPIAEKITTDPMRLKQVMRNLLSNAIKFTDKGKVELCVSMVNVASDNPLIQFEVIDTGIGLTDERVEKLFQPFVQGDTSMTRNYGGTGLGLTISKHLAEILGGDISVESNPKIGLTFRVRISVGDLTNIPMINSVGETNIVVAKNELLRERQQQLTARILLVEDCPDNRELISFIINSAGAELAFAVNGKEAVDMVLEQADAGTPYDIILMDMQMPVMDGYEATATLRKHGIETIIIALTAHNMFLKCKKCFEAGCDNLLSKPIDRSKFIPTLFSYITFDEESAGQLKKPSDAKTPFAEQVVVDISEDESVVPHIILSYIDKDEVFSDLLDSFCKKLPDRLAKINVAIKEEDFVALKEASHQIKETSGNYGFMIISESAEALECAAIDQNISGSVLHEKMLTEICHIAMRGRKIAVPDEAPIAVPEDKVNTTSSTDFIGQKIDHLQGSGERNPLIRVTVIKDDRRDLLVSDKSALIVSNDEVVSKMLIELCHDNNMKCLHANSCMVGEKLAETYMPDAVFLDIGLEESKDSNLLDHIKKNLDLRFIPIHIFNSTATDGQTMDYVQNYILSKASLFIYREIGAKLKSKRSIVAVKDDADMILKGKHVLVVDDIKMNRLMLTRVLEGKEMSVVLATNGQEALERLKEDKGIDLVLMDIMMPVMDGYEAMRCIRKVDHYKDIPIMAFTAKVMAEDRERCMSAGADDYMPKPVEVEELLKTLQVWLYEAN